MKNRGHLSLGSLLIRSSPDQATSAKSPCDRGVSIQFTPHGPVTCWSQVRVLGALFPPIRDRLARALSALDRFFPPLTCSYGVFGHHRLLWPQGFWIRHLATGAIWKRIYHSKALTGSGFSEPLCPQQASRGLRNWQAPSAELPQSNTGAALRRRQVVHLAQSARLLRLWTDHLQL
jgi:hypothetical protein